MPSAGLPEPRDLQKSREISQATTKVLSISTRQASRCIPLFFWRNDLFLRIKSSLFAYISCTSLWYWVKAPSSLDCSMAECFLALWTSFYSASARKHCITISLEHTRFLSGSLHDILHKATTITWVLNSGRIRLLKRYHHVPSSIARSGALSPSSGQPSPGR
jgi:hypothetical protein